ncbi:MAG TPA: DUF4139 domain-containing protein [Thermoanaerobaculia bacterium]|nr:DUF4139 domain-containing protein [Thermoanaerobaculia bacterium]HUM28883.1 DUF4139 domain-containing protein [Thermoanaerobaculia bacterium]HXK67184.1 DUF4139 domain-containing protein [Thermoanaerobaculia bacterium]
MRNPTIVSILALGILCGAVTVKPASPEEPGIVRSDASDQESVHLTVYNQNRALVNEVRNVNFPGGMVNLWFQDVASQIMPETVAIKGITGAEFTVREQNYEFDLLSPQKLLEKYLDRDVDLVRLDRDEDRTVEKRTRAHLLSTNNGTVWQIGDRIVVNPPYAYLEFPQLPANLYAKPTLVWLLDAKKGSARVQTTYLTQNITWKADYVFTLDEKDTGGDMIGWVTLTNNSGATYTHATLKLIAGDVNVVQDREPMMRYAQKGVLAESAPQFEEKSFFEYHMYTLQRPATLNDRQQKQIELLHADEFGVEKQFIARGQRWYYSQRIGDVQKPKVEVAVKVMNSEKNGLGLPLPKGTVRVYKRDTDGSSQFIGEDTIDHTPRDESIYLTLGNAFDLVTERRQTDYRVISDCVRESAFEIKVRNHKKEPATLRLIEPVGGEWEMLNHSHPFIKMDAFTLEFPVPVNPDEEVVVTYRVRLKYC